MPDTDEDYALALQLDEQERMTLLPRAVGASQKVICVSQYDIGANDTAINRILEHDVDEMGKPLNLSNPNTLCLIASQS